MVAKKKQDNPVLDDDQQDTSATADDETVDTAVIDDAAFAHDEEPELDDLEGEEWHDDETLNDRS